MGIPILVRGLIPNRVAPHTGLVFIPIWGATYALLEPNLFQDPTDPGAVAVYTQFAITLMIKTADAIFTRAQNEWNFYRNIQ